MPRYAIIVAGEVSNIVEADETLAELNGWIATDEAGPGWVHDGVNFIRPTSPPAPPPNPKEQARAALRRLPPGTPITVRNLLDIGVV